MAISSDPNDPNFGLETDQTSPNFGLAIQEPKESSVVENALAGAGDVLKGFAQQFVPKFDVKSLAELAYGPVNAQIQGYRALKSVVDTVEQVREADKTPPFSRERFAAGLNVVGQLGLLAAGARAPKLTEIAGLEKPLTPEVTPQTPETPITNVAESQPIIPEERFPSLLRSDENLRRGELQQQLNKERGFQLVPEPPPNLAPAPTLEQTLESRRLVGEVIQPPVQTPEQWFRERINEGQTLGRQVDLLRKAGITIPSILRDRIDVINKELQAGYQPPIETPPEAGLRTGIQSETATVGGEPNAIEQSNAQVQGGETSLGVEERPTSAVPPASNSDYAQREAQGTEAGRTLSQEIAPTVPQPEQLKTSESVPEVSQETGISNRRLTEAYGDSAPVATTGKGPGAWKDEGLSRLDNFQKTGAVENDPYAVLTNLREGRVPVSQLPSDVSLLRAEHQRLLEDARNSEGTPEYQDKSQAALDMATAIKSVAHGPASDVFRALQEYDKPRYDNVTDFDQALRERENRESTSQERVQFKKMADDVSSTRNGSEKEINSVQKRISKYPKVSFEDAAKSVRDQIDKLIKDCVL